MRRRDLRQLLEQWQALETRAGTARCGVRDMALTGLRAVVDFQDLDYGADYLDRLEQCSQAMTIRHKDHEFTREAAKYIAKAMAYDDVFRVADLKTRGSRFARVRGEITPAEGAHR
jgi:indolepyruvate ferredoxin oxidoreductase beta subunit